MPRFRVDVEQRFSHQYEVTAADEHEAERMALELWMNDLTPGEADEAEVVDCEELPEERQ